MSPVRLLAQEASADVEFGSGEHLALFAIMAVCLLALLVAFILVRQVLAADQGTDKMREIARAIQEGSRAYLSRQFRTVAVFVALLFFLLLLLEADSGAVRIGRSVAFLVGAVFSALAGYTGMNLAVRANVRVAAAADQGGLLKAMPIAFRAGGVAGMFVVGLGLLGAAGVVLVFQGDAASVLFGFGFGAALLAMFMRVGGGIFTKAADVGADLVGKVEQSIPEDDPRNAATIADNVGDNVGDCAGMAADLFESFEVTLVAAIVLGLAAFPDRPEVGLLFPLVVQAIGIVSSIVGIYLVRPRSETESGMRTINRGFFASAGISLVLVAIASIVYVKDWRPVAAVALGLALSTVIQLMTSYYTRHRVQAGAGDRRGVGDRAGDHHPGRVLHRPGGVGLRHPGRRRGDRRGGDHRQRRGPRLPALHDLAGRHGHAHHRWRGRLHGHLRADQRQRPGHRRDVRRHRAPGGRGADLPGRGRQHHQGDHQGRGHRHRRARPRPACSARSARPSSIAGVPLENVDIPIEQPSVMVGLLIGGSVAFMFSAQAIRAVGRAAGRVVFEVRKQFREHPGIMTYDERPDYGAVVDICTRDSLRELLTPGLLAVLAPIATGFLFESAALGAYLAGAILTGQLLAVMLSVSGGAWDNAKKYVEDGHHGGKNSEPHKATVIGDTVGDPFKDTAGPALNPLIKVMNLVAVLIAPTVVALSDDELAAVRGSPWWPWPCSAGRCGAPTAWAGSPWPRRPTSHPCPTSRTPTRQPRHRPPERPAKGAVDGPVYGHQEYGRLFRP